MTNYPVGSDTPSAPWNAPSHDEPEHPRRCDCGRFLPHWGWECAEVDLDPDGGVVWRTVCKHCGEAVEHCKRW